MAFRNKAQFILKLKPDILIVQECECFERLDFSLFPDQPTSKIWCQYKEGKKGLAIFSFGKYSVKTHESFIPDYSVILPVSVSDGIYKFNLFGVWTVNSGKPGGNYVDQIWNAIEYYDSLIRPSGTILIGDFNSNVIFDRKNRRATHSNLVTKLGERNIRSAYHSILKQTQGSEEDATFYLYRHQDKPFHIDHCFVSEDLLDRLQSLEIGKYEDWKTHSDHTPMILTFN